MKALFYSFLLFVLFVATKGQGIAQAPPPPPPPPPPAKDYFPDSWQEYSFPEAGYRIKLPGEPKKNMKEREINGARQIAYSINYGNASFASYEVFSTEYSQDMEDPQRVKTFLDGYREGLLSSLLTAANCRIKAESDISVDRHPGRLIQIEIEKKKVLRMKTVIVGKRLYTLLVITGVYSPMTMGAENDYEKTAMGFLNSFRLIESADKK